MFCPSFLGGKKKTEKITFKYIPSLPNYERERERKKEREKKQWALELDRKAVINRIGTKLLELGNFNSNRMRRVREKIKT